MVTNSPLSTVKLTSRSVSVPSGKVIPMSENDNAAVPVRVSVGFVVVAIWLISDSSAMRVARAGREPTGPIRACQHSETSRS